MERIWGSKEDDFLWEHSDSSLTEGLLHVPFLVINPPEEPERTDHLFSHEQFPRIVSELSDGCFDVQEQVARAERIGDNKSEHQPALRCVYKNGKKRVWSSNDTNYTREIEELDRTHFQKPLSAYMNRIKRETSHHKIPPETESILEDLGYVS